MTDREERLRWLAVENQMDGTMDENVKEALLKNATRRELYYVTDLDINGEYVQAVVEQTLDGETKMPKSGRELVELIDELTVLEYVGEGVYNVSGTVDWDRLEEEYLND